jgi:hypothetical protein
MVVIVSESLRLFFGNLYDFPAFISPAMRAGAVRQLPFVTIRALSENRTSERVMGAP